MWWIESCWWSAGCHGWHVTSLHHLIPDCGPSVCAFTPAFFALICGLAVWGGEQNATLAVFMYKTVFLIYNKVWIFVTPYTWAFCWVLLYFWWYDIDGDVSQVQDSPLAPWTPWFGKGRRKKKLGNACGGIQMKRMMVFPCVPCSTAMAVMDFKLLILQDLKTY